MKEFEIKIPLNEGEEETVRNRIAGKGFVFEKKIVETDYYFNHPCRDFGKTDEALRVRYQDENIVLTYKGAKEGKRGKVRTEFNVSCDSNEISLLLKSLGFEEYGVVKKTREYYKKEGIIVTIDSVEGLGCFVEIEVEENLWNKIDEIKQDIGLSGRDEERLSYLELLKRKR